MSLEVVDLGFGFRRRPVIDVPHVCFEDGVSALVGRNGAGKTTLIRLLATALRPRAGQVVMAGRSLWDERDALREYRRCLGWVPQSVSFPRGLTVMDYLRHAAWLREVPGRRTRAVTDQALGLTDLADLAGRRIETLSGGMRRRTVLAGAVMGEPRVLLLDEPTVGLDPEQRAGFMRVVRRVGEQCVVVLSTHLLEDVVEAARSAILLQDGQVRTAVALTGRERPQDLRDRLFPHLRQEGAA